jgi:hypothetical protein
LCLTAGRIIAYGQNDCKGWQMGGSNVRFHRLFIGQGGFLCYNGLSSFPENLPCQPFPRCRRSRSMIRRFISIAS